MTDTHVATTRRFFPPSEKHLADSDFLSFWGVFTPHTRSHSVNPMKSHYLSL